MNYQEMRNPIRAWAAEDRPREKMIEKGILSLTDAELLATLLSTGTRDESALTLARKTLDHFGGLGHLSRAEVKNLMKISGIGQAKATTIMAAFELGRRKFANDDRTVTFDSSHKFARYMIAKIGDLPHEVFHVAFLDRKNRLLGEREAYRGGLDSVSVDARLLFKMAMESNARSIIVCHNHPGGNPAPSKSDDTLTQHLITVSQVVSIDILDHLIVTAKGWYSYADQGRIDSMSRAAKATLREVEPVMMNDG